MTTATLQARERPPIQRALVAGGVCPPLVQFRASVADATLGLP